MRKTFTFGLIWLSICWAQFVFAQQQEINEMYLGATRLGIIRDLSVKYHFDVQLSYKDFSTEPLPLMRFRHMTLEATLEQLLKETNLVFGFDDGKLIIQQSTKKLPSNHQTPRRFNTTISGKIKDQVSGEGLQFAVISLSEAAQARSATTNADGHFIFYDIPSDTVTLQITAMGHQTQRLRLQPTDSLQNLNWVLKPLIEMDENLLPEKDDNKLVESSLPGNYKTSMAVLQSLPAVGEKDPVRLLQYLPGISGTTEYNAGLTVRGRPDNQNMVLVDGIRVYQLDHLFGFNSAFNPEAIKGIEIQKGGYGSQTGGSLGSVLSLTTRTGNRESFGLSASINPITINGSVDVPIVKEKATLFIAGRTSYNNLIGSEVYNNINTLYQQKQLSTTASMQSLLASQQLLLDPPFNFYDLNAKLTLTPNQSDLISFSYLRSQDQWDNSMDLTYQIPGRGSYMNAGTSTTDLLQWNNEGGNVRWRHRWNERFFTEALAGVTQYQSSKMESASTYQGNSVVEDGLSEQNQLKDIHFEINSQYIWSAKHQWSLGFSGSQFQNDYTYLQHDSLSVDNQTLLANMVNVYVEDQWNIAPRIEGTIGWRSSFYAPTEKYYHEPRLKLAYTLTPQWSLTSSAGVYHQFVNRTVNLDLNDHSHDYYLLADNDKNPVSEAYQVNVGTAYQHQNWTFSLNGYYDRQSNVVLRFPLYDANLDYAGATNYQADGTFQGIEMMIQKTSGRYSGWIGYTLGQATYQIPALGNTTLFASEDQTHEFKWVNQYQTGHLTFSATWIFATGKPYMNPASSDTSTENSETTALSPSLLSQSRLPNYHRLDLAINYIFYFSEKAFLQTGLTIGNVYDHDNVWYRLFEIQGSSISSQDVTMMGFMPSLHVRLNIH